ncbi:rRNA pseudouridine synthase [Acidilutibacter cellobiosedens]|uniref:Pseudouridine synthase n=2 Tax=Tissierellia TaxID=1737404 RepID=A0A410QD31_9FIRM|nr:rRNA pseudouridine synthase [Tissierellaceae bacterium]QAT61728.1 rRNA pseudouridine synthase [Acidilutibacter cellobiosedens]
MMRLQKYLASCGVASRRKSEELIGEGRIKVNDRIIKEQGFIVNKGDIVKFDNKIVQIEDKKVYILLNKPVGYVTTVKDQFRRKKVIDLIQGIDERIYPVGRLDYDTSGLLLLTNDGDLAFKITHPSFHIDKTYMAKVKGIPNEMELNDFRNGLKIDGYVTSKSEIRILEKNKNTSLLEIKIHEGKNRQIRKMCDMINHPVMELKRIALGNIKLGKLKTGKWRNLNKNEIEYIKNI